MSKDIKFRQEFRPIPKIQDIQQVQNRDPAFRYKNVIMTYKHDPNRVQRYLQKGWEIVETTDPNKDDRSFTPNSKAEKLRPQMLVEFTKDGHEQITMRILKTLDEKNRLDEKHAREQQKLAEAKRRGDRVLRRGNEIITTGAELNELTEL